MNVSLLKAVSMKLATSGLPGGGWRRWLKAISQAFQ